MYRVYVRGAAVECDTPEAVEEILNHFSPNQLGDAAHREQGSSSPVVQDQESRDRVMRFLSDMTPITGKILVSLLQRSEQGLSLAELGKILAKKDPKAIGGAIAGVGRKAKACGLPPHVVDFDKEQQTYRLTDRFMRIYRAAGSPPVEKAPTLVPASLKKADPTPSMYQQRDI